jgi:penicillin-insensitive murein DD-endopeptidase
MLSAKSKSFIALSLALLLAAPASSAPTSADQTGLAKLAGGTPAPHSLSIFAIPAKKLFGRQKLPARLKAAAVGSYALGCLAGAQQLPITGDTWQVMRTSRGRNWGTPQLNAFLERLSAEAKTRAGWNGFLVGDMSQPRGGPMKTGHASHQIGLDADIWFTPMPDHVLSTAERESMAPIEMVKNRTTLNHDAWTESRARLIQTVAQDPQVARIFVHPPIKAELCRWAGDKGAWLAKVRPLYGHTFHFHIRMKCPAGMASCKEQWEPHPDDGTGCGKELAYWYSDAPWVHKKLPPGAPRPKPKPPLTLAGLPAECRAVIAAP